MQTINAENTMGRNTPKTPLFIWQGTSDQLMPIADADTLVSKYCANGVKVQYKRITGGDHVLSALQLGNALDYLVDRFNGKAATTTCQ
jgi:predicted esterase